MFDLIIIISWCLFFVLIELVSISGLVGIASWIKTESPETEKFAIIDNRVKRIS